MIFINLIKNSLLNSNKFKFFKKINKSKALNHEEIEVAIGIIINPKFEK